MRGRCGSGGIAVVGGQVLELGKIGTGAEGGAGAGEHHHADFRLRAEPLQGRGHLHAHLVVDGVALVRPIEREERHGVLDADVDRAQ
jgi:hypothetical protein